MHLLALQLLSVVAYANPLLRSAATHSGDPAPLLSSANAKHIPNSYIIKLKPHLHPSHVSAHHEFVNALHGRHESRRLELRKRSQIPFIDDAFAGLKHTFNIAGGFLGYSGHFDDAVIETIRRHPDVEYIEQDSEVHTMDGSLEKGAPWGLARISHREGLSFGNFNKYLYSGNGGEGVDVYVIDTGTNTEHVDFEGRARWGKTIPTGDEDADGNGHGTHCSGTIAGKKFGVAKKANVVAVKVLRSNGSGSMSDVVKGVEFAVEAHVANAKAAKAGKKKGWKGSAANMSLGGGKSPTLDLAVNAAVEAGMHFAVAAGNDNSDACNYSPAAADRPVTVGASTFTDERAYFSNFGKCTDIFAPGLNIESTWIGSKYATNKISGTSMASPHIAGLLAYLVSLQPAADSGYAIPAVTPKQLKQALIAIATKGVLTDIPADTPNILAWNGGGSGNYSDIIGKGSFKAKAEEEEQIFRALPVSEVEFEVPDFTEIKIVIEKAGSDAGRKARKMEKKIQGKIAEIAQDIEELVTEELKDLVASLE